ncbi:MAG TPA: sialidase family protein [Ktedonobacterales bacterium]|nr:sialidase family protein [Ktedonobacterales bacterium]
MSEHQQHDQGSATPAELRPIHQRLLEDGGIWRAEFPPSASFRRGVEAFAHSQATQAATAVDVDAQDRGRPGVRTRDIGSVVPPPPRSPVSNPATRKVSRRLRGLVAVAAVLTIAALFGVVLRQLPTNGPAQRHPATATPAPAAGVWRNVGQFQARDGERVAVAPSDPYIVYRLNSATFAMERSDDGGATWRAVTIPPEIRQAPVNANPVFAINPLSANTVYLTTFGDPSKIVCKSSVPPGGTLPATKCTEQYVTTDGGKNWQLLMLPDNGRLTGMLTQVLGLPKAPLLAQGNRIYSLMTADPYGDVYRLVVSTDGVRWQTADGDLAATGQRIESYVASPTGMTVWTALADGSLWRSDDAGAHWARIASLPADQVPGTANLAAASAAAGKTILYIVTYSAPLGDIAPANVRVSSDGGKTWQNAPAVGVPNGQRAAPSAAMTRGDGSIVLLFRTPQVNIAFDEGILHDAAYYAWTPGAGSWTRLTPTFDALAVEQTWITPANGAKPLETIWALIYRDDKLTYDRDAYIKDGVYSISEVGLEP